MHDIDVKIYYTLETSLEKPMTPMLKKFHALKKKFDPLRRF